MPSKKKPTVYLDTTIPSAYWYSGRDLLALGRRLLTRQWWEIERRSFILLVSSVTQAELEEGNFPRRAECLKMCVACATCRSRSPPKDLLKNSWPCRLCLQINLAMHYNWQ